MRFGSTSTRNGRRERGICASRARACSAIAASAAACAWPEPSAVSSATWVSRPDLGAEGAAGRDLVRDLARVQADHAEVGLVREPEGHLVLGQRGDPAGQHQAVAGHDDVHAGALALAHDLHDLVGQHAAVDLAERAQEAVPAVQEHQDVRQPLLRRHRHALLDDARRSPALASFSWRSLISCISRLISRDRALGLLPLHHRAAVRQRGQRQQGAGAAVDAVDVDVGRGLGQRDRAGHRAQHLRAPRARARRR